MQPVVFTSGGWDGCAPEQGDFMLSQGEWYLINTVTQGAGIGQYTVTTIPLGESFMPSAYARVFAWEMP